MKIRVEFAKLKPVRYISHLELMDTIRRAVRRANLPGKYTQGYNPHLVLSLGQPLSVGMVGKGEFFDLELDEKLSTEKIQKKLNKSLPPAIKIKEVRYVPEGIKSLQAVVNTAVYSINFDYDINEVENRKIKDEFLSAEKIEIERIRRNKKNRTLDLKPMIYDIEVSDRDSIWTFTVSTGSSGNVRPSELIRALAERFESIEEVPLVNVVREGMYVRKNKNLLKPFAKRVVRS